MVYISSDNSKYVMVLSKSFFEFFSGTGVLSSVFASNGWCVSTLDVKKYRKYSYPDHMVDFMSFDYRSLVPRLPTVIWFGLPCTAWSKASGGFHFTSNFEPKTDVAVLALNQVKRVFEIIAYFDSAIFFIENPSSGLYRYLEQMGYFDKNKMHLERFDLKYFGSITQKKTDLITNLDVPFLTIPVKSVRGVHQKKKFSNLTYIQRVKYPFNFCSYIEYLCSSQLNFKIK